MKKFGKIMTAIMAGALMVGCFAGCGGNTDTEGTSPSGNAATGDHLARIKAAGVLTMATNAAFPPFETIGDNGNVVGVDVDIAQAIADKIGVKLEVKDVDFDTIVSEIETGKSDIGVAGMTVTPERAEKVDFSDSYFTSIQYFIVPAGSDIKTVEDLAGKRVGVQLGTTGDILISNANNGEYDANGTKTADGVLEDNPAELSQMKTAMEATQELINGRLDAVVIDKLPAESLVAQNPDAGLTTFELTYADGSKTDEQYAIAVAKGDDSASLLALINEVIAEVKANGTLEESINKHSMA
ncbi:MAG: transporter substrate-binding domain-containing protein [Clostridia bacterium]